MPIVRLLKENRIAMIPPKINEDVANNPQINAFTILKQLKLKKIRQTNVSLFVSIKIVINHHFFTLKPQIIKI